MSNLVRCKACGYIISKGKVKDVCPACGVKSSAFEDYNPKISENRLKKLEFDIHPIFVHFAQSFGPILILLGFILLFFDNIFGIEIYNVYRLFAILFPITVLLALPSGVFDGKLRFKKITPILKKKLLVGNIFLLITIIISIIAFQAPSYPYNVENNEIQFWSILILAFASFVCEAILGKIGSGLLCAKIA